VVILVDSAIILRDVRPWGGLRSDIRVAAGRIVEVRPHDAFTAVDGDADVDVEVHDGAGRLALPAFTDAHVHLDSTRIGLPFRPHSAPSGSLWDLIENDRRNWRSAEASVADRATETLERAILNGMTRARSYAQVDADSQLERFHGVQVARDAHASRADVEIVAFPQAGLLREPGVIDLVDQALREGADIVGGIDPSALDGDPKRHLDVVFDLAERHGARIDIHLHEPGELGAFAARAILERTRALDYRGRVTIAHAFCLSDLAPAALGVLLDDIADLDVAVTTIAPGGRTPLPLDEIVGRGIRFGLGQDGQRDYWSPYGNTDMLERTWMLSYSNGLRRDADIEGALAIASLGGARVMGAAAPAMARGGFDPGDAADFVLMDAETPTSAVMDRPRPRTVVHAGRVVAVDGGLR
jgi:cytosine/adenosine deaminase-related metal-dependent hydrolase